MLSKEELLKKGWYVHIDGLSEDALHKLYQAIRFNPLFSECGVEKIYDGYTYIGLDVRGGTILFLRNSSNYGRDTVQLSYEEYFEIFEDNKESIKTEKAVSLEDINFLVVRALLLPDSLSQEKRIELAKRMCSFNQPATVVNNIIADIGEAMDICTEDTTPLQPPHRTTSG